MGMLSWLREPSLSAARTVPSPTSSSGAFVGFNAATGAISSMGGLGAVDRHHALQVPALNNGVRLLTNITGQLPLVAESPLGVSDDTRTFLDTLDPSMPPSWTLAKTVESLIFHSAAYWLVTSTYATGHPRSIEYVDHELVGETRLPDGTVQYRVEGVEMDPATVRKFTGVLPGILISGALSIRTAIANITATRAYAENPHPHYTLTDPEGVEPLETDDARDYLQALSDSVRQHGSAYIAGLNINAHGWSAREIQLIEARDADSLAMAQLLALPSNMVGASVKGSSLTYSSLADNRRQTIDALASYTRPIEGRLSLPDMTPRSTVVKFDAASWAMQVDPLTEAPTPAPVEAPL